MLDHTTFFAVVAYLQEARFSVVATIKVKAELANIIPKSEKMCGGQQAHMSHQYVITVNNEIKSF